MQEELENLATLIITNEQEKVELMIAYSESNAPLGKGMQAEEVGHAVLFLT